MARTYEWVTTSAGAGPIDIGTGSVISLSPIAPAPGTTITRVILWLGIAGVIDSNDQSPCVAICGVTVGPEPSPTDLSPSNIGTVDWYGVGSQLLQVPASGVASVKRTWATSWQPSLDIRSQRICQPDDQVWLVVALHGPIISGSYTYQLLSRVLELSPA